MTSIQNLPPLLLELLAIQTLGVLSTHDQGQPYATLVAFAAAPDGREILFVTGRETIRERLSRSPRPGPPNRDAFSFGNSDASIVATGS